MIAIAVNRVWACTSDTAVGLQSDTAVASDIEELGHRRARQPASDVDRSTRARASTHPTRLDLRSCIGRRGSGHSCNKNNQKSTKNCRASYHQIIKHKRPPSVLLCSGTQQLDKLDQIARITYH